MINRFLEKKYIYIKNDILFNCLPWTLSTRISSSAEERKLYTSWMALCLENTGASQ